MKKQSRNSFKECFGPKLQEHKVLQLKIVNNEIENGFRIADSANTHHIQVTPDQLDYIALNIAETAKEVGKKFWWWITAINVIIGLTSSIISLLIHFNLI